MHSGQNKNVNPKLSDTREPLFMYMNLYPWKHSQISWWSITCLKSSLFILHHFHWQSKFSALYPVNRLIKIHVFFIVNLFSSWIYRNCSPLTKETNAIKISIMSSSINIRVLKRISLYWLQIAYVCNILPLKTICFKINKSCLLLLLWLKNQTFCLIIDRNFQHDSMLVLSMRIVLWFWQVAHSDILSFNTWCAHIPPHLSNDNTLP